jgi:CHAT domain-containing protein
LPAVPTELNLIGQQFAVGARFLNQNFTYANLQQQVGNHRPGILHLATHAEFNQGKPSDSYIQLWDQQLHIDQLKQLGLDRSDVELLVLSACNTATGSKDAELGFTGIAALSGVRTVLGSLWSVSDLGTLAFMTEFYGQLKDTSSRAEAMRQAQKAMQLGKVRIERNRLITSNGSFNLPPHLQSIESIEFSHPYYWSGFTMVGSPW